MKVLHTGRVIEVEPFSSDYLNEALGVCKLRKHRALTMPEIVDIKIENPFNTDLWRDLYISTSMKAIGLSRQGKKRIVYSHLKDNYFSSPGNILEAIDKGLKKGAGIILNLDFYRLIELDGLTDEKGNRLVWVLDYDNRRGVPKSFTIEDALDDPETIPFLGGGERAIHYLQMHGEMYDNKILLDHSNEFNGENIGWLLYLGNFLIKGLYGNYPLNSSGNFLGTPEEN